MKSRDVHAFSALIKDKDRPPEEWETTEYPLTFGEQYETHRQQAPNIETFEVLGLEALLAREGVDIGGLHSRVGDMVRTLITESEAASGGRVKYNKCIELFYQLHALAVRKEEASGDVARDFVSWESFVQAYLSNADQKEVKAVQTQVQFFIQTVLQPQQIIRGERGSRDPYAFKLQTFFAHEWRVLPQELIEEEQFRFASKEVIEEVIQLLEGGYQHVGFSHATGSAALAGIAQEGGLVRSSDLVSHGRTVKTGEVGRYANRKDGLRSVYADRGGPCPGYHVMNWFNEFPVTFGINEARHEAFLSDAYPDLETVSRTSDSDAPKTRTRDFGGDGVLLGPEVKLTSVDVVYCLQSNLEDVRGWVEEYAPHARVVSLEAMELLGYEGRQVREWALAEGIDPVDVWKKVLE